MAFFNVSFHCMCVYVLFKKYPYTGLSIELWQTVRSLLLLLLRVQITPVLINCLRMQTTTKTNAVKEKEQSWESRDVSYRVAAIAVDSVCVLIHQAETPLFICMQMTTAHHLDH